MVGGEELARGYVSISLDDSDLAAGLKKAEAAFSRTMSKIDRTEAVAQAKLETTQIDKKMVKLDRELEKLDRAKPKISIGAATSEWDVKRRKLQAEIDALNKRKVDIKVDTSEMVAANRLADIRAQKEAEYQKAQESRRRASQAASKEEQAASKAEQTALARASSLQDKYMRQQKEAESIFKRRRRTFEEPLRARLDLQYRRALEEMAMTRKELEAQNIRPIEIPARLDTRGLMLGQRLRQAVRKDEGRAMSVMSVLGGSMGTSLMTGIERSIGPQAIGKKVGGIFTRVARGAESLGGLTVRLGPLTTSLRGLVGLLALAGPALIGVVGSASALVGVLGAGLTGAALAASGAVAGLGLAAVGVGALVKPLIGDLQNAFKASNLYDQAVLKYGEGSDKANKKLIQLRQTLKGVSPETMAAFKGFRQFKRDWRDIVTTVKPEFFNRVGQALTRAKEVMPQFGRRAKDSFNIANTAARSWIDSLARQFKVGGVFDNVWSNFNRGLPSFLSGISNVASVLGDIVESSSRWIPRMGVAFSKWTAGLNDAVNPGAKLNGIVDGLVKKARDLGQFLMATGRLVIAFFGGGADAGQSLLNTLTKLENKWATAIGPGGPDRQKLKDFFNSSIKDTKALVEGLAPLAIQFVNWARNMSPFATQFFKGAAAVGEIVRAIAEFVNKLGNLVGMNDSVSTLVTTLGALWAISKIGAATNAVTAFTRALLVMVGAEKAAAAIPTLPTMAAPGKAGKEGKALGAAEGAGTAEAAGASGALAGAQFVGAFVIALKYGFDAKNTIAQMLGGNLKTALLKGAQLTLVDLNPVTKPFDIAFQGIQALMDKTVNRWTGKKVNFNPFDFGGDARDIQMAGEALGILSKKNDALGTSFITTATNVAKQRSALSAFIALQQTSATAVANIVDAWGQLNTSYNDSRSSALGVRDAQVRVNQLVAEGKQGTTEYKEAVLALQQARQQDQTAQGEWLAVQQRLTAATRANVMSTRQELTIAAGRIAAGDRSAAAVNRMRTAAQNYTFALDRQAAVEIQTSRVRRGMIALTDEAARSAGRLARTAGGKDIARKISLKFEAPQDVSRVAQTATRALKSGVDPRIVTKIVADASDAESAIRDLNRERVKDKKFKIAANAKNALEAVDAVNSKNIKNKTLRIATQGDRDAQAKVDRLALVRLGVKTQVIQEAGASSVFGVLSRLRNANLPVITQFIRQVTQKAGATGGVFPAARGTNESLTTNAMRVAERQRRPHSTGGSYNSPTLLVGEERRREYVIATNPAYKQRNVGFLSAAANDLGYNVVEAAAHGKKPKTKATKPKSTKATTTPAAVTSSNRNGDPKPAPYFSTGGVPEDSLTQEQSNLQSGVDSRRSDIASANSAIKRIRITLADKKTSSSEKKRARLDLQDNLAIIRRADKSGFGYSDGYSTLAAAQNALKLTNAELEQVKLANRSIREWEATANRYTTRMNETATRYQNTGDVSLLSDKEPNWKWLQGQRLFALAQVSGLYTKAKNGLEQYKKTVSGTDVSIAIGDLSDTIDGRIEDTKSDITDTTYDTYGTYTDPNADKSGTGADPASELARKVDLGLTYGVGPADADAYDADLNARLRDVSIAALDNVEDDPTTIYTNEAAVTGQDDILAQNKVVDFWQSVYDRVHVPGYDPVKTKNAADELRSARDTLNTLKATGTAPATTTIGEQLMTLSSARDDLYKSFGSNMAATSSISPMLVRSAAGGGAPVASGGSIGSGDTNVNITQHFSAPPPDAHTWSNGLSWELQHAI